MVEDGDRHIPSGRIVVDFFGSLKVGKKLRFICEIFIETFVHDARIKDCTIEEINDF